ncbi:MAG: PKD domain-containing protein [Acidobacteriota bacterium]
MMNNGKTRKLLITIAAVATLLAGAVASIAGSAPTASFVFSPALPDRGQPVVFDATASSDTDGVIVSYAWDFGDRSRSSQGPIVFHPYPNDRYYFVVLTVKDDSGLQGVSTATVPVGGGTRAPTACFALTPDPDSEAVPPGRRIKFDGYCSTDTDGVIRVWRWQFGDGTAKRARGITTHAYARPGRYTAFLTVIDDDGLRGVTSKTFTIGQPPVADAGADQSFAITCPGTRDVSFSGALSSDPDGTIVSYDWSFGDGSSGTGQSVTHTYTVTSDVVYTVILRVTGDDGLTDTDSAIVMFTCS